MLPKTARIFIAGHTGLIGSAIFERLNKDGYSNLITATHSELDLTQSSQVTHFFDEKQPECVILCAGRVGGILANRDRPAEFISENLAIQLNTILESHRTQVSKFIFFGSSCMYPKHAPQPMPEELLLTGMPEETSLPYALAKLSGVQMCLAYNRQYGQTRFIPLIPNNAYGPRDRFDAESSHVIPGLMVRFHEAKTLGMDRLTLWGTGTPRREFVFSADIADVVTHALNWDEEDLDLPMNIASGVDYSIREIAEKVAKVVGFEGEIGFDPRFPDGAPRKLLDGRRLWSHGWHSKTTLDDGLRQTYQGYLAKLNQDRKAPQSTLGQLNDTLGRAPDVERGMDA